MKSGNTTTGAPGRGLHLQVMLFVGVIILITIGISTFFSMLNFKKDYLEAIEWRSVSLAQSMRVDLLERHALFKGLADTGLILDSAYLQCKRLFNANRTMEVAFVCLLDEKARIITHNDRAMWGKTFFNPRLVSAVKSKEVHTIRADGIYHTLIPVISVKQGYLTTIDVGFPGAGVDLKMTAALWDAILLCLALFAGAFFPAWFFIRKVVVRPINLLIRSTSAIARGSLDQEIDVSPIREFTHLARSLSKMQEAIRRSMADLDRRNQEVEAMIACSPLAMFSVHPNGAVSIWAESARQMFGWSAGEVAGTPLPTVPEKDRADFASLIARAGAGEVILGQELLQKRRNGSLFHASLSAAPIRERCGRIIGVMGMVEDISWRIEREQAHRAVQDQLLQAQKMEAVGRLAGGVAHDYNNTLGVIMGYAELLKEGLSKEDPLADSVDEIIRATHHSVDIICQLLSFARKQNISPKVLELNECVEKLFKMLGRLIGEDLTLEWRPGKDVGQVNMDRVQVERILVNLCINARDAMDVPGAITIETSAVTVGENYCGSHPGGRAGDFVRLTVSDTGTGMEKEVLEKIFEPFFTTKARGMGTGLGLSTVYGIVKQNQGFINVHSEPASGTVFHIYIPKADGAGDPGP